VPARCETVEWNLSCWWVNDRVWSTRRKIAEAMTSQRRLAEQARNEVKLWARLVKRSAMRQ
jgi:hypothetical protein